MDLELERLTPASEKVSQHQKSSKPSTTTSSWESESEAILKPVGRKGLSSLQSEALPTGSRGVGNENMKTKACWDQAAQLTREGGQIK